MADDPNLQDRLLGLIFGLLPEDEAEALRAEIERDHALAEACAEAQAIAEVMGEAARLQSPRIPLARPQPNGRQATATVSAEPAPERAPWTPWAQWGVVAAASLLIVAALAGWAQQRSRVAGVGGGQLRLQVTGPSQLLKSVNHRYSITTTTLAGHPVSADVHFMVCSPEGTRLLAHTEKTGSEGTLQVEVPADPQLPDAVQIEVEAGRGKPRQRIESRVPVSREPVSTYLALDRSRYVPGETVRYRSVSLSRYHLEAVPALPIEFEIRDPQGIVVEGSRHKVESEGGVASGEYAIPADMPGGIYALVAGSQAPGFVEVRREFFVREDREAVLQKELELAGNRFGPGDEVFAAFRVTRGDGTPVSEAAVEVAAKIGEQTVHQDSATTDRNGAVAVEFRLPEQIESRDAVLSVTVTDSDVSESLSKPIPLGRKTVVVDFFPEGGDLAAVGENRVYFAAHDANGEPVELAGWIVDEEGGYHAAVKTVHEGRGVFQFSPRVGVRYRLIAESPADAEIDGQLPFAMPGQKIVLNTGVGILGPREPLEFNVRASRSGLPLVAMASCRGVHVGERAFLTKSVENGSGKVAANAVAIPLAEDAFGVIRLTVFDYSMSPPRPLAERLVYRRPPKDLRISLAADQDSCAPGATCQAAIRVVDEKGRPAFSRLGISVVDEAALERSPGPATMTSYFWLTSEVDHSRDLQDADFLLEDKPEAETALDLFLGTQGWRGSAERSLVSNRNDTAGGKEQERLPTLGEATLPPLMLDNLASLSARTEPGVQAGERGHVLGTLIVLGGSGLLVFVIMLSLLRIAGGLRVWVPAAIAVSVSLLLVFLMLGPDSSAARTVAFLSYRPPETIQVIDGKPMAEGTKETKEEGLTLGEVKESAGAADRERGEGTEKTKQRQAEGEKRDSAPTPADRSSVRGQRAEVRTDKVRVDLGKTVFWAPSFETDQKGQVEMSFPLSDSVTQYRAVADAHGDGRIGSAVTTIAAEPPFRLDPAVPEEVTLGDRIEIPVVVTDNSSPTGETRVSIAGADEFQLVEPTEVVAEPGGKRPRRWLFSAKAAGLSERASLSFRGRTGEHTDVVERFVRIEPAGYPAAEVISGVLKGKREFAFEIPEDVVPGSVRTTLTLFPSLVADLGAGLESITGDRFDGAVAEVMVAGLLVDYLKQNRVADPGILRLAKEHRKNGLRKLNVFRNSDGAYSRWEGRPADAGTTTAALLALSADRDWFGGSSEQTDRTVQWLRGQLDAGDGSPETSMALDSPTAAWLRALAWAGQTELGSKLKLAATEAGETERAEPLALVALAAARIDRRDLANDLLKQLASMQKGDGSVGLQGASDVDTTALATLAWLTQSGSFSEPASKAIAWLLSKRDDSGGFGSPRATAPALHALVAWEDHQDRKVPACEVVVREGEDVLARQAIESDARSAVVLEGSGNRFKVGKSTIAVELTEGAELPFAAVIHYYRREKPPLPATGTLDLSTELETSKVDEGKTVHLTVRLKNTGSETVDSPAAVIGLPAGLTIAPSQLDAEKKAGRIVAYETHPRRVALVFGPMPSGEQIELALEATATAPGEFSGPASFAYLQQKPAERYWTEPLAIVVNPAK
ncbi:MAG: hypothetical protein GXX96_12060 [Planctomycetaceae bacterium]|nr:hypothetical protein [Planctomycetaceae bacterium]